MEVLSTRRLNCVWMGPTSAAHLIQKSITITRNQLSKIIYDVYKVYVPRTKIKAKAKTGISSFCECDLWAPVKCCWRDVLSEVMGYERMLLWRKFSINFLFTPSTSVKDFCLEKFQLMPGLALHFSFYRVFPNHKGFQSNDHLGYIAPIMCHRSNIGYCIFLQPTLFLGTRYD